MSDDGRAGIDAPVWRHFLTETVEVVGDRPTARWLCEVAAGADAEEFLLQLDDRPTERMIAHLDAMVARYRAGEPLQYVLGRWGFRRLDLAVDERVLIPRADTELLVEVALERLESMSGAGRSSRVVADLGTGSGAVGLALADELPLEGTTVILTDVSADAIAVARANLAGIGRAARNVRIAAGDWLAPLDDVLEPGVRCDLIVSNPPYVPVGDPDLESDVAEWEPELALFAGSDGLDALRTIVTEAGAHLVDGGWLIVEHGHRQGRDVRELFAAAGFERIETRRDLAQHERVTLGCRPGGRGNRSADPA
jgi:release factor glutamine methyltransferase